MHKATSAKDVGTIFQLRNVINRKNIGKKPKKDVNAHEDFFQKNFLKSQLLYSRVINTHGLPGRNISCDLYMEHLNRLLKDAIKALGANKTPKAIDRVGKCIAPLDELLERFDTVHNCSPQSDYHKNLSAMKDITIMLEELRKAEVFHSTNGRKHHAFRNFSNNPVLSLKQKNVSE